MATHWNNLPSRRKLWVIGGIVLVVLVIVLTTFYSAYLGARVASGKKFKVLGPSTLVAGQTATITWDTSPKNAARYPYEKIEYCVGKLLERKCSLLVAAASNNGKAVVNVPASLPAGKGYLRFTARDSKRSLLGSLVATSGTISVKPAEPASSDGGGGAGGGGSGGGSGGGGNSSNTSAPAVNYELLRLCYEYDGSVHLRWRPIGAILRYRKGGAAQWMNVFVNNYFDTTTERSTIVFDGRNSYYNQPFGDDTPISPNTEFEFYLYRGAGAPEGLPAESQIYRYNTGPQPSSLECRSLL